MDSSGSQRSSFNFVQYVTEDGSLDYSADWSTFSFESELQARKNINKDNIEAFQLYTQTCATPVKDESVLRKMQMNKDVYNELLKDNENTVSKYNALINTYDKVLENIENLTARNKALESSIKDLAKEETSLQEEYQQLKLALQKGTEMYARFGISVKTKSISDTTYEALLQFKENIPPVKVTVDRVKRKVIDFSMNGVLLPNEEKDIIEKFGNLDNLPGLLCALHDIIIKK